MHTQNQLRIIDPATAWRRPSKLAGLDEAIGHIAASSISIYPPGSPTVVQGEVLSESAIRQIKAALAAGQTVTGLGEDSTVSIMDDPNPVSKLRFEIWPTPNLVIDVIHEFADRYAAAYASEDYGQFAFEHEQARDALLANKPVSPLSPSQVPGSNLSERRHYELSELDELALASGFGRWVDPAKCRAIIEKRCQDPGFVLLIRDKSDDDIVGFLHVRVTSCENQARTEEFVDQLLFAKFDFPGQEQALERHIEEYFAKLQFHTGLQRQDRIITISAQWLHPRVRGKGKVFFEMMHQAATAIDDASWIYLPYLAEIPGADRGNAHVVNSAVADRMFFGVLSNGDPLVYNEQAKNSLIYFASRDERFWRFAVTKRAFELASGYRPMPTDHPKAHIRKAGRKGLGVFATGRISKGEMIAQFAGEIYWARTATQLPEEAVDTAIQVSANMFVHGYLGLAEKLNHRCGDPNCCLDGQTSIIAARDIEEGEELCWDYRCSECSDWRMPSCHCGSRYCQGEVGPFHELQPELQKRFLQQGWTSDYIERKFAHLLD